MLLSKYRITLNDLESDYQRTAEALASKLFGPPHGHDISIQDDLVLEFYSSYLKVLSNSIIFLVHIYDSYCLFFTSFQ